MSESDIRETNFLQLHFWVAISTFNKILIAIAGFMAAVFVVGLIYYKATSSNGSPTPKPTVSRVSVLSLSPTPLLTKFTEADDSVEIKGVPFTAQAPSGKWSDLRFQDGCEEASSIMAVRWARKQSLTSQEAEQEIINISKYELDTYGTFRDTSPKDTVDRIIKGYFGYKNAEAVANISLIDIKNELRKGNLVLVQVNGQILKNPNYTQPGPERHMLVITGYDAVKHEFITNDSGTRNGAGYRYGEFRLWQSIRDYPTGDHLPITDETKKSMIVVRP